MTNSQDPELQQAKQKSVDSGGSWGTGLSASDCTPGQTLGEREKQVRLADVCLSTVSSLRDGWAEDLPVHFCSSHMIPVISSTTLSRCSCQKGVSLKERDSRKKRKSLDSGHIYSPIQQALTAGLLSAWPFSKSPY